MASRVLASRIAPLVFFCSLLAAPQQPALPSEDLTISVIVRDDRHRPVLDLQPQDLQITEDGKPVALKSLKTAPSGSLSILLDPSSPESLNLAREASTDLISSIKDTPLSLWDSRQAALLRDFNADRNAVTGMIISSTHEPVKESDASAKTKDILAAAHRLITDELRLPAFALLFALIEQQGGTPGRKEIVYFAPNGEDAALTEEQVGALASNALRAGVSIYIFEAAGASAQVEAKAAALLTQQQHGAAKTRTGAPAAKQNMWRELARRTGGAYALQGKDSVRDAAHRAGEDLSVSYQATYTSPVAQSEDGHFRPINVKLSRPHAVSQVPAGYFSVPPLDAFSVADYEPPLLQALHEKTDSDQLHFDTTVLRFGAKDPGTNTSLVVEVPRSSVTTLNNTTDKLLKVHFSVYALIRSSDGKIVSRFSHDIPYETAAATPKNLFNFQRQVALPTGSYRAEVAVADQNSTNVGTRTFTFEIAKPTSPLTLGDVILVRGVEPRTTQTAGDPLALGAQSLIPWASSTVRGHKAGELPVLLKIFGDPSAAVLPDLQLEIRHDAALLANLPLLVNGSSGGAFQAIVWLPEDSLETGHYTLIAHATQGQSTAESRAEFDYAYGNGSSETQQVDNGPDLAPKQLTSAGPELITGSKRPSDDEITSILQAARERALDYKKTLPNFSCLLAHKRFTSKTGVQNWKLKDTFTELLRYSEGKEDHQIVELNGATKAIDRGDVKGLLTKGEFGEFLDAVYSPDAHAEFTWQGRTLVDGQEAHVFAYKVKRANSIYSMSTVDGRSRLVSAFHGLIHLDASTLATRFVSIEAEDIPAQTLYRESSVSVAYAYFTIEGQKFLLPKSSVLSVRIGKRALSKDEMQFRNYRRYGATSNFIFH